MTVKIKICGLTDNESMVNAVQAGADALGFVFYQASKRAIDVETAMHLIKSVPSFVSVVGLFVNPQPEYVKEVLKILPLDELQFHGNETAAFCRQFNRRYIKAIPMQNFSTKQAVMSYINEYDDASGLLFDTFGKQSQGGSGQAFDWELLPQITQPLIIAGGLNIDNIAQVITQYRPYAVDVSSGVENSAGKKSSVKMKEFVTKVRALS